MSFRYSRRNLEGKERVLERALEILPGAAAWTVLLGLVVLSVTAPQIGAAFMITFLYYWVLRLVYYAIFLFVAFIRVWAETDTDWMARLERLAAGHTDASAIPRNGLKTRVSRWFDARSMRLLHRIGLNLPDYRDIVHLIIIPVYNESREVFEPGIRALAESDFPAGQMVVCLAVEQRAQPAIQEAAHAVAAEYASVFREFLVTVHPADVPGEARVKGANVSYAARRAARYFDEQEIPYAGVIVSCFDADTIAGSDYFACLTHSYVTCPDRTRASFQPIPLYNNNIWRVPVYARILEMGSTIFQLVESTNHDLLVSFSSHSLSFEALHDVGYWPVDIIADDSSIYWKSLIHFDGDFRVVPMPTTLSMDAPEAASFRQTFRNMYKQKRRWAWGVENLPLAVRGLIHSSGVSVRNKIKYAFKLFDTYFIWATWPFLLTFLGWLPGIFGRIFNLDAVAIFNLGRISSTLFQLSSISLIATIAVTSFFIMRNTRNVPLIRKILYPFEWILLPVMTIFLSGIPALDAQTRLMFGRHMEFWVSEKSSQRS